jgi:hypothetical protein
MGRDRDDDRKRHRSHSHKRSSRHKEDRHRKSSRRDDEKRHDESHHDDKNKKLTEEEERLYETAKAYVQQQESGKDRGGRDDKRSKRHKRDDDSISDESRQKDRRRHHKSDGHKSRKRKDHKRSKRDDDKKKHRRDKDEKKRKEPSVDTSKLVSIGAITDKPPPEQLDPSLNYFSHNPHLRLYLYRTHSLYFEDLSSESTRKYFTEFVDKYNSGKLEEAYYNTQLPEEAMDQCSRTKHQWKFKTNEIEEEKLNLVKAGVRKQTEYDADGGKTSSYAQGVKTVAILPPTVAPRQQQDDYDREQSQLAKQSAQKLSDKRHRERINLANEEIYGINSKPSSGYERQQMKKREQSNKTHGAYKDREESFTGAELDDDAIYGGKEMGYNEAVAKERVRRDRRQAEMASRVEEGKRKEEEKRKEMLAMLGLSGMDAGKKIRIAPRSDGV